MGKLAPGGIVGLMKLPEGSHSRVNALGASQHFTANSQMRDGAAIRDDGALDGGHEPF